MKTKIIAFYLPQYHPMPENDEWWGKGFTEWTSVVKAKPLYRGHKQPKIPADLGFYDLRLAESREAQAELAKRAGIYGFCYWHYWFNGKKLMDRPFNEVLASGKPDFPFCVAWANHSWHKKGWGAGNKMIQEKSQTLIEQTYGGKEDCIAHFYDLLPAFKDNRYIKINGKLLFMIYDALHFPDFRTFSTIWNELAEKENIPRFHFVTHVCDRCQFENLDYILSLGYDAVNVSLHRMPFKSERRPIGGIINKIFRYFKQRFSIKPEIVDYGAAIKWLDSDLYDKPQIYPTILPNWDHTPRSGRFGRVLHNSTPQLFQKHVKMILSRVNRKPDDKRIIFLKSWNEWGEGNYLEPDLEYGDKYIQILGNTVNKDSYVE